MSDESDEMRERRRAQKAKEFAEFQTDHAEAQRQLDWAWQMKLARDAEEAYRRSRPEEVPEQGEYSPIARFERETRHKRSW
jgi:hypothetical protein